MIKKFGILIGALAFAVAFAGLVPRFSQARIVGQTSSMADTWCVGPSGAEVCVDSTGDFLPTTTGVASLGTASLKWTTLYTGSMSTGANTVTGNETVGGTLGVTGTTTLSSATASGTLGVTGTTTLGVLNQTGAATLTGTTNHYGTVYVSTSATAGYGMCMLGAVTSLPTTGYPAGCIVALTSDPTHFYLSTQTVVGTQSWLAK